MTTPYRKALPQLGDALFVTDGGIETALIFNEGLELPDFAAFDLFRRADGEAALRRYYAAQADIPAPQDVCPDGRTRCAEFTQIIREAGLVQLQTIFLGAAICCVVAGVVALVVFRRADTRDVERPALSSGTP